MSAALIFAVIAVVLLGLAALGVSPGRFGLVPAALCLLTLAFILAGAFG